MKTLYDAENAIEAHMLQHLLQQEGITASVHGDYLQGAVGGLPVAGLARLLVDEGDYDRAREIIQRWEARSTPAAAPLAPKARQSGFITGLIGLAVGGLLSYAYFHAPYSVDGIDYDADGILDEHWTWAPSGIIRKSETDRNRDGKVDSVAHYNRQGHIATSESDDDFDGVFETQMTYRHGNPLRAEADSDGDGYPDLRWHYKDGVLATEERFSKGSEKPLRITRFQLGREVSAAVDTDGDGRMDLQQEYDASGTISTTGVPSGMR